MLNKVMLIGYLGRAPQIKRTNGERRYALLSLATSKRWRNKDSGDRRERTDWHRLIIWAEHAIDLVEKHCMKGSRLWIEGELSQRSWTDDGGARHWVTEVVVMPFTGVVKLMDARKGGGVPDPESADDHGHVTEMERTYV